MDMSGVTIGAHSVSHGCFRDLSAAECSWEINNSKTRLEVELGHPIDYFAYPYGILGYDRRDTTRIVAKAGFRNAFTLDASNSHGVRPFEIGRRSVSRGMFVDPYGKFNKSLLATELCGLGDIIFGRVFSRRKDFGIRVYR
jgi:peptidoglycan/xylan/chitin deacetylase (PgdA/CDA1 family)